MTDKRDKNGRFAVGNPGGGRPKIPEDVKEAIRAACPKAVAVLVELLDDKKSIIRLEAAKILLERGYGKPEAMSKVELTTTEDTRIIFHWINEDTENTAPIRTERDAAGNSPADRDA